MMEEGVMKGVMERRSDGMKSDGRRRDGKRRDGRRRDE